MTELAKIKAHLKGLGSGSIQPLDPHYGLCFELSERFGLYLEYRIGKWPDCFGEDDLSYPVGGCSEYQREDLWDDSPWSDKRRALCAWLANNVEEGDL